MSSWSSRPHDFDPASHARQPAAYRHPRLAARDGAGESRGGGARRGARPRPARARNPADDRDRRQDQDRALAEVGARRCGRANSISRSTRRSSTWRCIRSRMSKRCATSASSSPRCSNAPIRATGWWCPTAAPRGRSPTCRTARGWGRQPAPRGAGAAHPARPRNPAAARQCRDAARQARGGRCRCDAARRGGTRAARHGRDRHGAAIDLLLPAASQGAIGIECRAEDARCAR